MAIFPFVHRGLGATLLGEYLADKVAAGLSERGLVVVERVRLDSLRREHELARRNELDDATAAEIGNLAGASLVVVGTLTPTEADTWELVLRCLHARTGEVALSGEAVFDAASVPTGLATVRAREPLEDSYEGRRADWEFESRLSSAPQMRRAEHTLTRHGAQGPTMAAGAMWLPGLDATVPHVEVGFAMALGGFSFGGYGGVLASASAPGVTIGGHLAAGSRRDAFHVGLSVRAGYAHAGGHALVLAAGPALDVAIGEGCYLMLSGGVAQTLGEHEGAGGFGLSGVLVDW